MHEILNFVLESTFVRRKSGILFGKIAISCALHVGVRRFLFLATCGNR
jgi:hypothetical protein